MSARGGSPRQVQHSPAKLGLKRESKDLVRDAGGVEASDTLCRIGKTQLSDCGLPNTDAFLPVDVIADLEAVTVGRAGWPRVTRLLCRMNGGVFVPLPTGEEQSAASIHEALAEETTDHSALATGLLTALADGKVTREEARELRAKGVARCAAEAAMRIDAMLERIAEGG